MKSEKRYCLLQIDETDIPVDHLDQIASEEFMDDADNNGWVYSEEGFQEAWNNGDFDATKCHLRIFNFIKCDCGWSDIDSNLKKVEFQSLNNKKMIELYCPKCNNLYKRTQDDKL